MPEESDDLLALKRLEVKNLTGENIIEKVASLIKKVEESLEDYYVDSCEIDLGVAFGIPTSVSVTGKVTVERKITTQTTTPGSTAVTTTTTNVTTPQVIAKATTAPTAR